MGQCEASPGRQRAGGGGLTVDEDLHDGGQREDGNLDPDWDLGDLGALCRKVAAGRLGVDLPLKDGADGHRQGRQQEAGRDAADGREIDALPAQERVEDVIEEGDADCPRMISADLRRLTRSYGSHAQMMVRALKLPSKSLGAPLIERPAEG